VKISRRTALGLAATLPLTRWTGIMAADEQKPATIDNNEWILSDFSGDEPVVIAGAGWRGFSDRVMGGISDASFGKATVAGKNCVRLSGRVTRESNGGFIQMAMYFGAGEAELDASAFNGIQLLIYGNNEDYNVHIRTADCGWYDESYRHTFFAKPEWQEFKMPWSTFKPNGLNAPLDSSTINRIAILGWMREFQADIALARLSLYK
jgi:hypothetical protein